MKKEESLYNCLIIKEQKDYFGDNQLLSFEEIIRTNLIYDINFMAQNIQKDEFSFSTIDDRRFFLNKKENRNNIIKSSKNSSIDSKDVKFLNSINGFKETKETIPISSSNGKIELSTKKEAATNSECLKKKEKKRQEKSSTRKLKKKTHRGSDDDNVLRKIQVHFLSFIICFANDVVKALTDKKDKKLQQFKNLDYRKKKIVNHEYVEGLKSKTIGDILKFNITPKMKKNAKQNKDIYEDILKECPNIDDFFKMNYLTLFKEYYFNKNNIFQFNGKIIPLSEKTKEKTFNYLIKKHHSCLEKIKYVCINYYFNCYKRIKKPNFKTQSFAKNETRKKNRIDFSSKNTF